MANTALRVEGLSKRYRLGGLQPYQTLRDSVVDLLRGRREQKKKADFWALSDVSFELKEGEVLGIVGRNGAGKSTLLKLLSRITSPDTGSIEIHGRMGSLLEVGTGFHPELTGRENIFMNGTLLGMRRKEIERKFDEIVEFSGVEEFLDTPVKRYSSGMRVRLGFAVAAHLEPEILVVDEVLAVGDAEFQRKCLGRMNQVASEGRTVLYVSHQMDSILGLCNRAIWLDKGTLRLDGSPSSVVKEYLGSGTSAGLIADLRSVEYRDGLGDARFLSIAINELTGSLPMCGESACFTLRWRCNLPVRGGWVVRIIIRDQFDRIISILDNERTGNYLDGNQEIYEAICLIDKIPLVPAIYFVDVSLWAGRVRQDKIQRALAFEVLPGDFFGSGVGLNEGLFCLEHKWSFQTVGETSEKHFNGTGRS
jgi:lipopolysaccharide transport system ATP-binding protein